MKLNKIIDINISTLKRMAQAHVSVQAGSMPMRVCFLFRKQNGEGGIGVSLAPFLINESLT